MEKENKRITKGEIERESRKEKWKRKGEMEREHKGVGVKREIVVAIFDKFWSLGPNIITVFLTIGDFLGFLYFPWIIVKY